MEARLSYAQPRLSADGQAVMYERAKVETLTGDSRYEIAKKAKEFLQNGRVELNGAVHKRRADGLKFVEPRGPIPQPKPEFLNSANDEYHAN